MSVEKFRPQFGEGKIRHEPKPYTLILNKVLNECKNMEAIGLWCHFQSKPTDWVINVQYVQNQFNVGRDKAYNLLRYLIKVNLMKQVQEKKADGTFAGNYYIIKSGEEFLSNIEKLSTPLPENPHPVNPHPENPTTTNKRFITNKSKQINKSFCSSNDEKKKSNQKKHPWAEENKKAPLADVTSQSNSYTPQPKASDKTSKILEEFMEKEKNAPKKTTKLSTRTALQSKIPPRNEPDGQGAAIDAEGYQDNPSTVRGPDGLLEARGLRTFLEKAGLAG